MKPSSVLTATLIAGTVAVASVFAAAPAVAATLPAGAKIVVIDQYGDQFYNASPSTAISTPAGTATPVGVDVTGVDVDDTGLGYAIGTFFGAPDDEELVIAGPTEGWLYKADANTGALTDPKQILIDDGGDTLVYANECTAIDYSKGVITAVCYTFGEGDIGYVGTIDPSGEFAVLTNKTTLWEQDGSYHYFTAIAINPLTGIIYGFDYTYTSSLWTITLDGADPELVEDIAIEYAVWGADFDRGGQLWLTIEPLISRSALNTTYMQLATFDFAEFEPAPVDNFGSEDPYDITRPEAITVWGVLAATGSTVSAMPAIAASGILLVGALLAAGTMAVRRRTAAD